MDEIVRKLEPAPAPSPAPTARPAGSLDRQICFRVTASTSAGQKKVAEVWSEAGGQPASSRWRIQCDEGARLGGEDSAPSPLAYFTAAVAF
jgi:hypothetical protein